MRKGHLIFIFIAVAIMMGSPAWAAGKSSVEFGKKLFNDSALGGSTNETTCNSCHKDGEGLKKAGGNPKLAKMVNRCLTGQLKGEKIDGRTVEMRSLKMYIESLGN